MRKYLCLAIFVSIVIVAAILFKIFTHEPTLISEYVAVFDILNSNEYDEEIIFKAGLDVINHIAQNIEEFKYWQNIEVINTEFLRSYYTGKITYALFDILGANEQYGHIILDCKTYEAHSFSAGKSPYKLFEEMTNEPDRFLFYGAMSYGYGVINENGQVDIYDIMSILEGFEPNALYDVQFLPE